MLGLVSVREKQGGSVEGRREDWRQRGREGECVRGVCRKKKGGEVLALEIGQPNPSVRHTTRENLLSSCSGDCPGAVRAACQPI